MRIPKKPDATARERVRLNQAITHLRFVYGEAQWLNGYRAGAKKADDEDLFARESKAWAAVTAADVKVVQAIRAFARSVLRSDRVGSVDERSKGRR